MFNFSENSMQKLRSCHKDLQRIAIAAIQRTEVDFGIAEGYRSIEKQQELFEAGKTTIDGVKEKSKHNYKPAMAFDIFIYHPKSSIRKKIANDPATICYVAGILRACSEDLLQRGVISHRLRWGGNINENGVIEQGQSLNSLIHFEIL